MKEKLEAMLAAGRDNALLRFSLGEILLQEDAPQAAAEHLAAAVEHDPDYSAAWKLYGQALAASGEPARAVEVFDQGIAVAEARGDNQAVKEMRVFRKRASKQLS
ncbi:MAG TPA: tetratricopeptide repeat protein [Salinisphaeraceae bacterium]|nr:tetratricopeptide repeat protein [Salinisphaeraceae bacterium]